MRGLGMVGRFVLAVVALAALLVMGAGAAVAGFVGSDDTVFNESTALGEDGRPILTAPDLLAYDGITVTLRASAPDGVFIGTAHPVDVADFVGDSSQIRLTSVTRTGVTSEGVGSKPPVQPASAVFWTRSMSGDGVEELTLDRDNSAAQWVIAPRSGTGPTTVSFGVTVDGIYRLALIVSGGAAMLLLLCVDILLRTRRRKRPPPAAERIAAYVPGDALVKTPVKGGRRKARRTALTIVLTLSLAGCDYEDLLPAERQSADQATTKVALTRGELPALFESYDARLRAAIEAARPPRYRAAKWKKADRGVALESDLFGTRVTKLTKLGRRSMQTHDGVEAFSGRFDSYPMWSLVASKVGRETRVDLFTKASVEAGWLRHAGSAVSRELPGAGRAERLPSGEDASTAAAAWRDYLRSGDPDDRLAIDPASKSWRDNIADLGGRAMFTGYTVDVEPELSRVVEVDDGALALVALRVTTRLDGRPDLAVRWAPPYGKYRPGKGGMLSFADVAVGIIHLPNRGEPTMLGSTFSEVAVESRSRR